MFISGPQAICFYAKFYCTDDAIFSVRMTEDVLICQQSYAALPILSLFRASSTSDGSISGFGSKTVSIGVSVFVLEELGDSCVTAVRAGCILVYRDSVVCISVLLTYTEYFLNLHFLTYLVYK